VEQTCRKELVALAYAMLIWITGFVWGSIVFTVIVLLFKNGLGYFASLTVWLACLILISVSWFTGRPLAATQRQ
jgi:hypothetical protein